MLTGQQLEYQDIISLQYLGDTWYRYVVMVLWEEFVLYYNADNHLFISVCNIERLVRPEIGEYYTTRQIWTTDSQSLCKIKCYDNLFLMFKFSEIIYIYTVAPSQRITHYLAATVFTVSVSRSF